MEQLQIAKDKNIITDEYDMGTNLELTRSITQPQMPKIGCL